MTDSSRHCFSPFATLTQRQGPSDLAHQSTSFSASYTQDCPFLRWRLPRRHRVANCSSHTLLAAMAGRHPPSPKWCLGETRLEDKTRKFGLDSYHWENRSLVWWSSGHPEEDRQLGGARGGKYFSALKMQLGQTDKGGHSHLHIGVKFSKSFHSRRERNRWKH